jgi:tetratricopeptide (TPR) repeat protein
MMANLQRFTELAELVADGQAVDWESAASGSANDAERGTVEQLRAVASISRLFATVSAGGTTRQPPKQILVDGSGWGALRVLEHVGSGRFGDVYRAWDPALDREVALKILCPFDGDAAAETQVIEEGRLMARVRHPNVVTIYGAQRISGVTGLWMEFVDGRTLAAELAQRGPFTSEEITTVGIQLCRALEAVHGAGLVHRDVKAQNVLRQEGGRIVLGDFGTGREIDHSRSSHGSLAGTPTYLAPELFAGLCVSFRSDIYSLGVLLFFVATGKYPVTGRSLRDLRDAHAQGRRTLLASLRPDLPKLPVQVVETALDTDPARRHENAEAMGRALERSVGKRRSRAGLLAACSVALAATVAATLAWSARNAEPLSIPFAERDWVLVTAFENHTGDTSLDGVLEYALERELANSTFINVVPRDRIEDTLRLMRRNVRATVDISLGREVALRDGRIVAGRVEKMGGAYSVTARIANPADGSTMAGVAEASIGAGDLLRAMSDVSTGVRRRLGETLPHAEPRAPALAKVTTRSMRALQLYSQARSMTRETYLFRDPRAPQIVEQLLMDALDEDPDFVWARILLAHAIHAQSGRNVEVIEHLKRAAAAAPAGVERFIADAELSAFTGSFSKDADKRVRHLESALTKFYSALQLQPDDLWALSCLLNVTDTLGRVPGRDLIQRYADLRPNSLYVMVAAADYAFRSRYEADTDEYLNRSHAILKASADHDRHDIARLHVVSARHAWRQREIQQALISLDNVLANRDVSDQPVLPYELFYAYVGMGRWDRAERVASLMRDRATRTRFRIVVASERGDHEAVRALATRLLAESGELVGGSSTLGVAVVSALVDARMFAPVRKALVSMKTKPRANHPAHFLQLVEGLLSTADGRIDHGVDLLEKAVQRTDLAPVTFATASRKLADARLRKGETKRAIAVLERASRHDAVHRPDSYAYVRARATLAELYRHVGRTQEAIEIESDLRQLLAVAVDDHPVIRRLGAIRAN